MRGRKLLEIFILPHRLFQIKKESPNEGTETDEIFIIPHRLFQ